MDIRDLTGAEAEMVSFKKELVERPVLKVVDNANSYFDIGLEYANRFSHDPIHKVCSVIVKNDEVIFSKLIKTSMIMKDLTDQEIHAYVDEDKPFNSCGSYMFEKNGYKLFKETSGSLEAINGLPFNELKETINEHI